MSVNRVNDRLLNANGERASNLCKPRISSIPVPSDDKIHNLLLSGRQWPGRQRSPQVLASLEQFRQADIGMIRPAHDTTRLFSSVVDARLFGVHVSAL
jgi:hypothetical protein